MGTGAMWSDLHTEMNPEFFSEAQPVELPELSWQDVENLAAKDDEPEKVSETQQPEPEPEPSDPAKKAEEREQRIKVAERCFDRTTYDNKLRGWSRQDRAMDEELAQTNGKFQHLDRYPCAFHAVVSQRIVFLHASGVKVRAYSGSGKNGRANTIDFIADAELVAKRALKDSPTLWRVFQEEILVNGTETWQAVPIETRAQIEQTVGRAYIRAGLHPKSRYFA